MSKKWWLLVLLILLVPLYVCAESEQLLSERVGTITYLNERRVASTHQGTFLESAEGQWVLLETKAEKAAREEVIQAYVGRGNLLYSVAQVLRAHFSVHEYPICDYYLCVQNWDGKELSELRRLHLLDCGITYGSTLALMVDEEAAYWFVWDDVTGGYQLFRIQLSDGKVTELLAQQDIINVIESDDPTSFFVVYRTLEGEYGAPYYHLASFDRRDGTQRSEPLTLAGDAGWLAGGLVAYDAASGQLYGTFPDEDKLYCLNPDGTSRQSGYLEPGEYSGALIEDGEFVLYGVDGCQRVPLEQEIKEPEVQLQVLGGVDEEVLQAFRQLHPEVEVKESYGYLSPEDFAQQMVLQDSTYDIYFVDFTDIDFRNVMEKHYCVDLSGSEIIRADVQAMVPEVVARVTEGERIYALPCYYGASAPAYYASVLESLGLTEADLPTTYDEFLDFVVWFDTYRESLPEPVYLFNHILVYRALVRMITTTQVDNCIRAGEPITVDTPEYRALLERLTALRPVLERCSWTGQRGFCDGEWLFEEGASVYGIDGLLPFFPAIAAGDKPCAEGAIGVAFINPYSQHQELALELLELEAANRTAYSRVGLYADANEPVLNEEWTAEAEAMQQQLEEKQALLATADPEDVRDLQMEVDSIQAYMEGMEVTKYDLTEEQIQAYRVRDYDIVIPETDWMSILQGDFTASSLMRRLEDGALSVDGFVDLLAREMWMRQEEDK